MTLVDCRECSGRVARSAKACPHCGAPDPKEATWLGIGCDLAVGALSIVAALAFLPLVACALVVVALSVLFIG